MVEEELGGLLDTHLAGQNSEDWDVEGLVREIRTCFPLPAELQQYELRQMEKDEIQQRVLDHAQKLYQQREEAVGEEGMRQMERLVMLHTIDSHWVLHLTAMENLRQGVGLHAYGQRDPLVAYRMEAHEKFREVMASIRHDIVRTVYLASLTVGAFPAPARGGARSLRAVRPSPMAAVAAGRASQATRQGGQKVGRNEPCTAAAARSSSAVTVQRRDLLGGPPHCPHQAPRQLGGGLGHGPAHPRVRRATGHYSEASSGSCSRP